MKNEGKPNESYSHNYIIVAKDGNHQSLIEAMNTLGEQEKLQHHEVIDESTGVKHLFRFANHVRLNASKLATNLAFLTFLAFMVDQIQEMASPEFKAALKKRSRGVRTHLWKCIARIFLSWLIESWDELFEALISGIKSSRVVIDSS